MKRLSQASHDAPSAYSVHTKQTTGSHFVISSYSTQSPWGLEVVWLQQEHIQWVDIVGSILINTCMVAHHMKPYKIGIYVSVQLSHGHRWWYTLRCAGLSIRMLIGVFVCVRVCVRVYVCVCAYAYMCVYVCVCTLYVQ